MSDPAVGELFTEHFVSAHQQVGDFRVVKVGNQVNKNGGNVASHFLTPDGHVIHSVTGPVKASVLLDEARWALAMYEEAKAKPDGQLAQHFAYAHHVASQTAVSNKDRQVHELLMNRPYPHLQTVYEEIFEKILGQKVSEAGPRLIQASQRLEYAAKTGRPILFVMHERHQWSVPEYSSVTEQLINEYVVIMMPLKEAPALSQLTEQPPFVATGSARPLFVVARSDCGQLSSVAGWNERSLATALASGWADALERKPPTTGALVRAQRLLRKANPASADRVRDLTRRLLEEAKAAREAAKKESPKWAAL